MKGIRGKNKFCQLLFLSGSGILLCTIRYLNIGL